MSGNQGLTSLLNSLQNYTRINLSEQYIGDEGARELARFLRTTQNVKILELKGNNIGPSGIKEIFNALQQSNTIRSLFCEWNNIGLDIEGINAVSSFLLTNKSIRHLGLSNNKISGDDFENLSNSIRINKNLLSLDLKWNELGTKGGMTLKKALDSNDTLIYLDVNGNNIPEDIFDDLEEKIKMNYKKNPLPRDEILGQDQNFDQDFQDQQENYQQPPIQQIGQNQVQSDGLTMIHHLENVLQQERLHTQQIKQRLEQDLEDLERKDRNDLRSIQELETRCSDVQNQNKMMKFDIERLRDEFNIIEKSNTEQIRQHEDRIRENQFLMEEMEKKHRITSERLLQENNYRVKELNRDWEARCRALEERTKAMEIEKGQIEDELKRLYEKSVDLKIRHEDELRDLSRRVEEEEQQKFQANLTNIEARIKAVEEGHDLFLKKNSDLISEYEQRDHRNNEEIVKLEQECHRLEQEHDKFVKNNNDFKILVDKLTNDFNLKENLTEKLEKEINGLNEQIEVKKKFGRDQVDRIQREQSDERKAWEHEREQQLHHIQELERQLRGSHSENTRLRQEYLRLSEIVQSNVNKTIFTTFSENHYY